MAVYSWRLRKYTTLTYLHFDQLTMSEKQLSISSADIVQVHSHTHTHLTPEEKSQEKRIVRKIDLWLLPILSLLYLLSFLDRSNAGNARLEGLNDAINLSDADYLTSLSLYFVGYILCEVPSNIILKRTTPRIWLPTVMLLWGVTSTLTGVVSNSSGFLANRFFLGVTEAGLFPGVLFYFSMWYQRNEIHYRVALFFACAALAGAFGGLLAYGIGFMKGIAGLGGWAWIFIIEGLVTVVVAIAAYFLIFNYPSTARFLSEEEREIVKKRLEMDGDAANEESFEWKWVWRAFTDVRVWLYAISFHALALPLYTLSMFLPSIINNFGYSTTVSQLLTVPVYAAATITTLAAALLAERTRNRCLYIIAGSVVALIGYILLLTTHTPGAKYVGVCFAAAGIYPALGTLLSWPSINVSGQTKRSVAAAIQIMIGDIAPIYGVQIYRSNTAPRYIPGHATALGFVAAEIVITGILWWVLTKENRRRDELQKQGVVSEHDEWMGDEELSYRYET